MFAPESWPTDWMHGPAARFNEAGACLPRKPRAEPRPQCRRRASMRPGHVCPGNSSRWSGPAWMPRFNEAGACLPRKLDVVHVAGLAILASMRPGHVCPGNASITARTIAARTLQ